MELERTNMLFAVAENLGGKPIGLSYSKRVEGGIDYNSQLIVFEDIIRTGKDNFSIGPMNFLRRLRPSRRNHAPVPAASTTVNTAVLSAALSHVEPSLQTA